MELLFLSVCLMFLLDAQTTTHLQFFVQDIQTEKFMSYFFLSINLFSVNFELCR